MTIHVSSASKMDLGIACPGRAPAPDSYISAAWPAGSCSKLERGKYIRSGDISLPPRPFFATPILTVGPPVSPCREERRCRFCSETLPDWKECFPTSTFNHQPVQPLMAVALNGVIHQVRTTTRLGKGRKGLQPPAVVGCHTGGAPCEARTPMQLRDAVKRAVVYNCLLTLHMRCDTQVPVKQGPGAMEEFQLKIRELFNIGPDAEIDVSFVCKVPCGSGEYRRERGQRVVTCSWQVRRESLGPMVPCRADMGVMAGPNSRILGTAMTDGLSLPLPPKQKPSAWRASVRTRRPPTAPR